MRVDRLGSWVPNSGTTLDSRYRIMEPLDAGGAGVVLLAEDQRLGRKVAIKLLHESVASQPGYKERFEREARVATKFDHNNIVRLYDFGTAESGALFLVMELLEGESLKQLIRSNGALSTRRAMNIAVQLLDGLSHAHAQEIVHRDLKPGNVFVTTDHRGDDIAKVLDFGLAKSLQGDDGGRLTQTGAICGTAKYIAPEILIVQESDKAGDVYAAGLILLEMILGSPVFGSPSMAQTFTQHLLAPVRIPDAIWGTPLAEVIIKATQKHPDDRYSDADSMYHALRAAMFDTPDITIPVSAVPAEFEQSFDTNVLYSLADGATLDVLRNSAPAEPFAPGALLENRPTMKVATRERASLVDVDKTDEDSVPVHTETVTFQHEDPASGKLWGWGFVAGIAVAGLVLFVFVVATFVNDPDDTEDVPIVDPATAVAEPSEPADEEELTAIEPESDPEPAETLVEATKTEVETPEPKKVERPKTTTQKPADRSRKTATKPKTEPVEKSPAKKFTTKKAADDKKDDREKMKKAVESFLP